MELRCNGVFEGGGVRGIGHVGAAASLEEAGYRFQRLAGCSAGAIVASLLASGYTGAELTPILAELDYLRFRQEGMLAAMGPAGKAVSLWLGLGVYNADYFEEWLSGLLSAKGIRAFGDLPPGRLQVIASDVTDKRLLVLPRDLEDFGLDPDSFSIAAAVRMSMSIPLFYKPYRLQGTRGCAHLVVDGGLLSNYPVWLFDDSGDPWPTIGFRFLDEEDWACEQEAACHIPGFPSYIKQLSATALDGADRQHMAEDGGDYARTVTIPVTVTIDGQTKKIRATDFDLTEQESRLLFLNGVKAARLFLQLWCFEDWKKRYPQGQRPSSAAMASSLWRRSSPRPSASDSNR